MRGLIHILFGAVAAWSNVPAPADQAEMQRVTHELVSAVNDRNIGRLATTITTDFDAYMPRQPGFDLDALKDLAQNLPADLGKAELAVLVRGMRMLTGDVALGDAFYRTIHLPGGDSAGYVLLTFVRQSGKWLIAAARFTPVPRERPYVAVEASDVRTDAGPDGWITLFNGRSADAFQSVDGSAIPPSWTVENRMLKAVPGAQRHALRTKESFGSFELLFEWKTSPKGNSGVKYRLFYMVQVPSLSDAFGHEYQITDDLEDPGARSRAVERSGALYNQLPPTKSAIRPVGEFNQSRIVVRGRHCEHWLNGEKVVEYETESSPLEGPILLQHHGTEMWFRDMRIRRLDGSGGRVGSSPAKTR